MTAASRTTAWVVRHADAGERGSWEDDRRRPLDSHGREQARRLAQALASTGVDAARRVLSSPYLRCVQTVEPLAAALGLRVETEDRLAEGTPLEEVLALLAGAGPAVHCTHGDVTGALVARLDELGLLAPGRRRCAKGSTWLVELEGVGPVAARYLDAPA